MTETAGGRTCYKRRRTARAEEDIDRRRTGEEIDVFH